MISSGRPRMTEPASSARAPSARHEMISDLVGMTSSSLGKRRASPRFQAAGHGWGGPGWSFPASSHGYLDRRRGKSLTSIRVTDALHILLPAHGCFQTAVSTRSATGARVRLGRPGWGGQVIPEDFPGRPVAEAAPRGVVEPVGEPAEAGSREHPGRALARREAPGAAVQVLDAALRMLAWPDLVPGSGRPARARSPTGPPRP